MNFLIHPIYAFILGCLKFLVYSTAFYESLASHREGFDSVSPLCVLYRAGASPLEST